MARRAARTDANQTEIVQMLRKIGASVQSLAMVGQGVPDLLVGFRGENFLFEIKDGDKPPSKRNLTSDEETWHMRWQGQVQTVNSIDEALQYLGLLDLM